MKTRILPLASMLLLVLALSACGNLFQVTLLPPGSVTSSGTPAVITSTPPLPTSTPVIIPPTDTPVLTNNTPISLTVVPAPQISYFHMTDFTNGWAVGETYILHTADGGLTWYEITPPGVTGIGAIVSGSSFLNANTAWLAVVGATPTQATLYHTIDGGLTWTNGFVPFDGGYMQFLDGQRGFVLTSLGAAAGSQAVAIYQTADGGLTWKQVYVNDPNAGEAANSLPFSGQKSGMTFLDGAHGWIGGNIPMPAYIYLYATQDGGATWVKQDLALPSGFESAMTEVKAPVFFTPLDGVLPVRLLAEPSSFVFYVTHDGGLTWTATFPLNFTGHTWMASLLDLWLWDGGPSLYVSHDSGLTWSRVTTNVNVVETLWQFEFVDVNTGWMLTGDSTGYHSFYKTTDGGANWDVLIP